MAQGNNEQQYKKEYAEFIDHAAHDLDAPLRKVAVLIERLTQKLDADQSKEVQGYVQRIHAQLSGMRSMIDSLADLSRISAGPGKIESFPVESIVEEAWWGLKQQVNDNHATIHTTGASLPVVEADREQYKRLFCELFSNSLRFRKKEETPRIEIYSSPLSMEEKKAFGLAPGKQYFQLTVSDNGIGFRQEDAEKIFKPFVQLHGKSAFSGNGIGLALCKRIIENHRGIIFAKSAEDAGARFIFILPQTIN
jgi:signal transduction histidine kinase